MAEKMDRPETDQITPEPGPVHEVTAPIHRVTVFRNGALVVRRGVGSGTVQVSGLPLLYNSDSLRIRAERGEMREMRETCSLHTAPGLPAMEVEGLREFDLGAARLADEVRTVDTLVDLYKKLSPVSGGKNSSRQVPDAQAWMALHSFAHHQVERLAERRRQLVEQQRQLEGQRRKLVLQNPGDLQPPRCTRGICFTLKEVAAEVGFEIEYFVPAARWVPTYTLHLAAGRARIELSALVAQATGEDWQDAALSFSTADLARESTLPELSSWRIGRAQTPRRPVFRPLPSDLDLLFAGYDRGVQEPQPVAAGEAPITAGGCLSEDLEETTTFEEATTLEETATFEETTTFEEAILGEPAVDESTLEILDGPLAIGEPPPSAAQETTLPRGILSGETAAGPSPAKQHQGSQEPLPPRLRYAYLRLMGPNEPDRGTLQPMDPLHHLFSLVADHENAKIEDLRRALAALREAAESLRNAPIPGGTTPLHGTSFHHTYDAPSRHTLPTDGTYHRLFVERTEAPAVEELRTVPQGGREVYRFCLVTPSADVPYPEGPLQVYENNAFRVGSRLGTSGDGKALELNLGVEPAVRVLHRTVKVQQEESGMVNQKSRILHQVQVRLRSSLAQTTRVLVYDRLPTPADDQNDLQVEFLGSVPEAVHSDLDPFDQHLPGGLRWEVEVAPGATAEVDYRYRISLPAKMELQGGNRRE